MLWTNIDKIILHNSFITEKKNVYKNHENPSDVLRSYEHFFILTHFFCYAMFVFQPYRHWVGTKVRIRTTDTFFLVACYCIVWNFSPLRCVPLHARSSSSWYDFKPCGFIRRTFHKSLRREMYRRAFYHFLSILIIFRLFICYRQRRQM